jgi:sortase A
VRIVFKRPAKQVFRWTQRLLFVCAALMLGYCGFALVDGWVFQHRERLHLEQLLRDRLPADVAARQTAVSTSPKPPPETVIDGLIGRIDVPRLGLSVIVIEGIDRTSLRRGVGHIPGTALPGKPGNVGLAGHRDTFFRALRNIRQNDTITLTTLLGEYRYRVVSIAIVSPLDIGVLAPSANQVLTLVTCYPFTFVGPAPERFIVRAERVMG